MTNEASVDPAFQRFTQFLGWSATGTSGKVARVDRVDEATLTWTSFEGTTYATDLSSSQARAVSSPPVPDRGLVVRPPDAEGLPPVLEIASPDGRYRLTELDSDLAVRNLSSGEVRRLTDTGSSLRPWRVNAQVITLVQGPSVWSDDGDKVFTIQADLSQIPTYPMIDWMGFPMGLDLLRLPTELTGGAFFTAAFVDIRTGAVTSTELESDDRTLVPLRWTKDGKGFLVILASGSGVMELARIDSKTGQVRIIAREETVALLAYLGPLLSAVLTPLPDDGVVGWLSDVDGDARLYALDIVTGERTPLTPPDAQVARVVGVDAEKHVVMLVRSDVDRPYDVHVCRTDLAANYAVLTREPGTHEALLLPDGRGFVDVHSALTRTPRSELRGLDGALAAVIDVADTSASDAWRRAEPQEFCVKAADGKTDLYGVLYVPSDFDPQRTYPVIDSIYGGPQVVAHPNAWAEPPPLIAGTPWTGFGNLAQAFAQLGFVGVVLDSRGTPGRGRAFQSAAADQFGTLGVQDHAAALRQLGEMHPWMDITRAGAIGLSFGGYFAARCGLVAPDVYKAVVAAAGPYDPGLCVPLWFEAVLGASFAQAPGLFEEAGLVAHADEFEPELLLIHGTHDANVTLAHTMRWSDALVRAGKPHETLILQNQQHRLDGVHGDFALMQAARFFVRHLAD